MKNYKFNYQKQQFYKIDLNKSNKRLATLLIFIIFAVAIVLGLLVLSNKTQAQKQKKMKQDTIIRIDSTKFIKYFIIKNDTVDARKLTKMEMHNVKMDLLIKKKKK